MFITGAYGLFLNGYIYRDIQQNFHLAYFFVMSILLVQVAFLHYNIIVDILLALECITFVLA